MLFLEILLDTGSMSSIISLDSDSEVEEPEEQEKDMEQQEENLVGDQGEEEEEGNPFEFVIR
jgi:hypothetical protein